MKLFGWIFIALSWAAIFGLALFCFSRILRKKKID
jgi:uncharacterized membrane protein